MGIDPTHLRKYIITPTLKYLDIHSVARDNIMMGTAAKESDLGTFLRQLEGGPARGIFQMEPDTHDDIWRNYILYRRPLAKKMRNLQYPRLMGKDQLIGNLPYATAMAALQYWRSPEPLPTEDDVEGMARMWKKVYNTPGGKGTEEEFIVAYNKYVR